jgi:hypothetical protein
MQVEPSISTLILVERELTRRIPLPLIVAHKFRGAEPIPADRSALEKIGLKTLVVERALRIE